jgi:hypothetical protein
MNFNNKDKKSDNISHNILSLLKKISYRKNEKNNNYEVINDLIPIPLEFKYSFTLNSNDNKEIESKKVENPFKINIESNKNDEDIDKKKIEINWQVEKIDISKLNVLYKKRRKNSLQKYSLNKKRKSERNSNQSINDPFLSMKELFESKKELILNKNKKNKNEYSNKNTLSNNKHLIQKQELNKLYNSNRISLWESDEDENDNNNNDNQNKLLQSQIDFISKVKENFIDKNVKEKTEYDINLDKGKVKKVHKKNDQKFKHNNYFQNISNKKIYQSKI